MRRFLILLVLVFSPPVWAAETVVSFGSLLPNPDMEIHNQSASDDAVVFFNHYNSMYDSWGGFAFSTVINTTNGTWGNQYGAAEALTNAYAVAYDGGWDPSPEISFDIPAAPKSIRLNNSTYVASAIRDGGDYNRAFTNGDFFVLTLTASDIDGTVLAVTNHTLADFRDGESFIQTNWTTLDLSWMPSEVVSVVGTLVTTDVGMWGANTPMYFAAADLIYAYADSSGGMAATNPAVLCWASGVADYAPGSNVSNQFLNASNALGAAETGDGFNGSTNVVSLGDGGTLTLTFSLPLKDGPGADFAVYENALSEDFLELATVEVSSDGTNFVAFPCHSLEPDPIDTYASANASDATAYGGFAGKHLQGSGTPFDLGRLPEIPGFDPQRVTHVRLTDVTGDGSVTDSYGNPVYDPFPTWGSGGFDLDGVGALHVRADIHSPTGAVPDLPGFETVLEYTARLNPPAWSTNTPAQGAPGFFRYKMTR
jgi:Domain of unknown function (DUF4465)